MMHGLGDTMNGVADTMFCVANMMGDVANTMHIADDTMHGEANMTAQWVSQDHCQTHYLKKNKLLLN